MRTSTRVLLGLTCIAPGLPLAAGVGSALRDYRGVCPGFSDGEAPCRFIDYAATEATFALVLAPMAIFLLAVAWLAVLVRRLAARSQE